MANIGLLNLNFVDGSTHLNADRMNAIVSKVNELVTAVNSGTSGGSGSNTPVSVSAPTISISGSSATITAESGATLRYTTDGSTPSASSGTAVNSNTVTFTPSGNCTIKAVAIKSSVVSSVASQSYTAPSAGETWQSEDLGSALSTIINKDNVWATSETNYSRMIPAVPGRQYKIEATVETRGSSVTTDEDGAFAFLTNNDTTAGNTPSYAGDAEDLSIVVYGAEPTIVTAPSNAAYLYIADYRDGKKWAICNVSSLR